MRSNWRSLKTRLTLLTLTIFVIGVWALSHFAQVVLRDEFERSLGEQQRSTVSLVAAQIDHDLAYRFKALHILAGTIDRNLLGNPAALQDVVGQRKLFTPLFNAGIFVTRRDGTAMAELPLIGRVGVNYMDRDPIAAALKEGKATIGKPVVGRRLVSPSFAMAVPVVDAGGEVIGAVAGVTDLSKPSFLDPVGTSLYGKSGGYLIVDPKHNLFVSASNNKSLIMTPLPAPGVNTVLDRRLKGFDGVAVNVNSLGTEVLTSSARLPTADWLLIATLPTKEAFAPLAEARRRLLVAATILVLSAGVLAWWMVRRQLAPMTAAAAALATQTHSDKRPLPLSVNSSDEIGDLIRGFNELLETLQLREERLRSESEKTRAILLNASDGITIMDPSGNLLECSYSFCRMLGYTRDELIGMHVSEWDCAFLDRSELMAAIRRQIDHKERSEFETRHRRKDGSTYDVEISGVPIELDGMPVLFNSSRDISRRKAATEEIHRLNASLESRVSERTRDLLAANQELEAFSYSVAHDLRTPLRAISSFAQVIEEDCASGLDDAGKDALQRVQKAASRMGQLIDDVLRLSRLTRQEMLLETVDLGALACANIEELRAVEPGRSVICEIPAQLLVRGDKRLLDILIGNLIRNAWKFTGKQIGARIELGAGKCGPDTVYFVRDNGAGFDMAHSANLFRPFHRAHSVDDFAGTGIGLATVKRIVERHNGRVWAEGAPDKGATF